MIFLYNHCLDEEGVCKIRRYIQNWRRKMGNSTAASRFRFILTPFKDLQTAMAITSWGAVYMTNCFNERDMDSFISKHYRESWEDFGSDGPYNYLLSDFEGNAEACGAPAMSSDGRPLDNAADGLVRASDPALEAMINAAVAKALASAKADWMSECGDGRLSELSEPEPAKKRGSGGSKGFTAVYWIVGIGLCMVLGALLVYMIVGFAFTQRPPTFSGSTPAAAAAATAAAAAAAYPARGGVAFTSGTRASAAGGGSGTVASV
jgi:hypothetical protein